jgi:hypothetical protein
MPIAATNLDKGSLNSIATSFNTASVTNTSNALLLLSVSLNVNSVISSVTGLGLTWVLVNTTSTYGGSVTTTLYRALGAASTGAVTVNFSGSNISGTYVLDQVTGVSTAGTNGSGAVAQSVTGTSSNPISISLAALGAGSASYGTFADASFFTTFTPGSGYSQVAAINGSNSTTGFTEIEVSGSTTVNCSSSASSALGGIAIEIVGQSASGFFNHSIPFA